MSVKIKPKDMKAAYRMFTKEPWSKKKALPKMWQAAWEMANDAVFCNHHYGYYEPEYPVTEYGDEDDHVGCYSYPNCDIDPNGCCILNGDDAEPYGHRD
jgi:hypothetical protein